MKKLKVSIVLALVFVSGFVAGIVVTRAVMRRVVKQVVMNPDRLRLIIERRMTVRLKLDMDQRVKVDQILKRTQEDLQTLRQQFAPPFQTILSNAQTEISAVLTPEQRERFTKFREENRHLWQPP